MKFSFREANVVFVFEKNSSILFDVYKSPTDAAKSMGLNYYSITRHINKDYFVAAGALAISTMINKNFSFLQNPLCLGNSKCVEGKKNGVTRIYNSITECTKIISPESDPSHLGKMLRKAGSYGIIYKEHNLKLVKYTITQFDWSSKK